MRNRLDTAGWGLLLVWTGALILLPGDLTLQWHVWLLGVGAIVLGAAVVALRLGFKPGWDSWIVGIVAFVSGLAGLFGIAVSAIGLGLLLFGFAFLVAVIRPLVAGSTLARHGPLA
jgi:uncharacterized membrane protein HdeD (DUF308 family)